MKPKTATVGHWLVKSEPETYSWSDLVRDRKTDWTGVRNSAARLHLKAMAKGDRVLFYHSGESREIVGLAEVSRAAFPDATADEPGWVAVELLAVAPLARPVSLNEIKTVPALANMTLLRISRLSVQPVSAAEFARILKLGGS
jgi:predicted RNA-binding protein with PUA-like domain